MKIVNLVVMLGALLLTACNSDNFLLFPDAEVEAQSQRNIDGEISSQTDVEPALISSRRNSKPWKVFRAANPIAIDGLEDDWDDVPRKGLRLELDFNDYTLDSKFDCSSYAKMLWDDANLYIFVSVLDDEIKFNTLDPGGLFNNDGVEFYIDGDNSKNVAANYPPPFIFPPPAYDNNDNLVRFFPSQSGAFVAYPNLASSAFDFMFAPNSRGGYNLEIQVPLASLGISGNAGDLFGVEFQVNDSDNDVERETSLKWFSSSDFSFYDPSLFGTAVLFDSIAE